jgi:hypothetical protein
LIAVSSFLRADPARAAVNLVVVESRGIRLDPGQVVDGGKPLVLSDGQLVTLISPDGKLIKLRGPSDKPPAPQDGAATADVGLALKLLVTQETTREKAGVIRGAGKLVIPPEPWLIDVSTPGTRCLPTDMPITFWRPTAQVAQQVTIAPSDRSWRVKTDWEIGEDRLSLPRTVSLRKRSTYVVRLGDQEATLNLIALPASLDNDVMRARWMLEEGCAAQVQALLNKVEKTTR